MRMIIYVLLVILACIALAQTGDYYYMQLPMRDGKWLAADLWSLDTTIAKPVILIQTPYDKDVYHALALYIDWSDTTGFWNFIHYNFVIVDWRGFCGSSEAESTGYERGHDGYDCIEWLASCDWCDGNVGTFGGSALGAIQFMTARFHPPHLVCCAPWLKDFKMTYNDFYYGGVWRKEHSEIHEALGFSSTALILDHPTIDYFWEYVENIDDNPEEFEVPMLLVSGWFDHFPDDILGAFYDLQTRSAIAVRDQHRLIMGPWTHEGTGKLEQGELEFPEAEGYDAIYSKLFFDYYLRGVTNDYLSTPDIQYFQMGENEWRMTDDWYSLTDTFDTLYLGDGGLLSFDPPVACKDADVFQYDPREPSPAVGSARFNPFDSGTPIGPYDISDTVESRDDVLVYSTPVLVSNLPVIGSLTIELYASSDRLDTDFSVRLCDVYPDGASYILTEGIRRGRFRNSFTDEELMTPGEVYQIDVELRNIAHTFLAGHRLRIVVTSSSFPRFDNNLNNGGEMYVEGDTLVATNSIYHDALHPSRLILPMSTTTSIAEKDSDNLPVDISLKVFPNPFNSGIRCQVSRNRDQGTGVGEQGIGFEIFDLGGNVVEELMAPITEFIWIPNESISSGIYLVRARTKNGRTVSKRVVYLR